MIRNAFMVLCLAGLTSACDYTRASEPPASVPPVHFNFMNGPSPLPQVLRFEEQWIAGWFDVRRGTSLIIGAPLDPQQSVICGGSVDLPFMPMQFVGDFNTVFSQLLQDPDATVLVYDEIAPSLEDALCGSEPAGRGTGFYMRHDNDFFGTGGNRTNAFGEHVTAELTMADGSRGRVSGGIRGVGRDGALVFAETWVVITSQ